MSSVNLPSLFIFLCSVGTMFVVLLFIASSILVANGNGYGGGYPGHDYTSCTDVGGEVIRFHYKLDEQDQISCADPNGGNNYKSLRASSCDRCGKICKLI